MAALAEGANDGMESLRREIAELRAENARLRAGASPAKEAQDAELLQVKSELTSAKAALAESETREGLILESATGYAILTTDLDGRVTAWNEGARLLMGWEEAEALGEDARMIFTPEDRAAGAPEMEMEGARTQGRAEDERWHVRKDGSRFWASGLMMPLKGPTGEPAGYLKILRDRTEELNASRNQLRRLEQMKALAEAARSIIGASDLGATLQAITDAARNIIGAHQSVCSMTRGPDWSQAINAVALSDKYARWRDYATMPDGGGIYAWLCEGNRTVRMTQTELEAHPRWRGFGEHAREHPPMRGWLATALVGGDGGNLGLIQLSDKIEGEFDEADEAILVQLAQLAASAIERAQAEEERREAQGRLAEAHAEAERRAAETAAILSQLAEGVIVTDRDGRITFVNEAAARIHGVARLDVEPEAYAETYHLFTEDGQPYPPEELPLARAALRRETVENARWRIRRPDGREVVAVGAARPIRMPEGDFIGAVLTLRDETARVSAETALQALNANLEAEVAQRTAERDRTWNNARDLLLVVDTDGVFRAVNPAWTAILGWRTDELVGRSYLDFIHPDDHPSSQGALATASRADLSAYENRYRHKDGSYRWISWVAAPEGDLIYASGRDVTMDKQREAELEQTQAALRQSQKMEAVGQLTGGIAHDFNNLLAGIIGALDLMQTRVRQGRTGEVDRYVTAAMSSAQRAASLTHRLLAFSRRQPLDPKPVEPNALVAGMEDLLRRTIGPATNLELVLAGGLWRTLCDPVQLESALLNLCINARDAMPEGGSLIVETCNAHLDDAYAAAARDVTPGQYVCIAVTDTGTGMPPEVVARVFDPFFTTKPIGQGTGLGLSMVYGFAKQSEGHVRVYSEPGQGTTVKIYLPRHRGGAEKESAARVEVEAPRAEVGETVLVVEDEPVIRDLVVEVLTDLGYRALEAVDGPSGLRLLNSDLRVDLVVTDIGLPGMNGRQLADQARERRPDLKVLFMTGFAGNAMLANGLLEPGMQMITKPFAIDALAARIRQMIEEG
ncbi:MAG TPA: PAS domain S-box protein [Microvirga sp.]|jgi:PAS domain S-box-containing protein